MKYRVTFIALLCFIIFFYLINQKWDSRIRYHKVDYVSERVVRSVSNTWIITDVIKRTSSGTSVASSGETSRIGG